MDELKPIDYNDDGYLEFCTEKQREYFLACRDAGSQNKAAKNLGISRDTLKGTIRTLKRAAARRGYSPEHNIDRVVPDNLEMTGLSDMQVNEHGKPIWYKYSKSQISIITQVQSAIDHITKNAPVLDRIIQPKKTSQTKTDIFLLALGDPHAGMKAHERETGAEFSLELFTKWHMHAIRKKIDEAPLCERIYLIDTGDGKHADNLKGETSKSGNSLDMDGTPYGMIEAYTDLILFAIQYAAKKFRNVDFVNFRGNHSGYGDYEANVWLSRMFSESKQISILSNEYYITPYLAGSVFIAGTHYDQLKPNKAKGVVLADYPTEVANANYVIIIGGHYHSFDIETDGKFTRIICPNLPTNDKWHQESNYRSLSGMLSLTISRTYGIRGIDFTTLHEIIDECDGLEAGAAAKSKRPVFTV